MDLAHGPIHRLERSVLRSEHRPGEGAPEPGDQFDLRARDLADLAVLLPG